MEVIASYENCTRYHSKKYVGNHYLPRSVHSCRSQFPISLAHFVVIYTTCIYSFIYCSEADILEHKGLQTKALHWADEVNEPLQTEHTIPHWDRRPNLAMFRLDLMRAARQPIDEAICCFMSQKTLVGVGLVSLILLGSIAVVLLFKLIGFI